jgi:S-(hydroxymethyl)glutathione dehydrogenase/alcohol dehydrogenase
MIKTRAVVAWTAEAPLTIGTVDLQGPRQREVLVEVMATCV